VLLILVVLIIGTPILWAVSVGALREAGRARRRDPRDGCQAWVSVPGLRGRLYRCCEPLYAGGPWCRPHEVARSRDTMEAPGDVTRVDEPQAVGRAIAQARIGVPIAVLVTVAAIAVAVWLLT
jgi:hypothetical protein